MADLRDQPVRVARSTIHTYALCILARHRPRRRSSTSRRLTKRGAEPGVVLDIVLWAVPLGIIGARIYHVLTHPDDYFYAGANIWNPFEPARSGTSGRAATPSSARSSAARSVCCIGCRMTGIRFWSFADALAPGLLRRAGRSAGSATGSTTSSSACRPTCRGASRSSPTTRRSRSACPTARCSTRRSSTRSSGTSLGVAVILLLERRFNLRWGKAFARLPHLVRPRPLASSSRSASTRARCSSACASTSGRRGPPSCSASCIFLVQRRRHTGVEPSPYVPGP